jgi:hypothetical protein
MAVFYWECPHAEIALSKENAIARQRVEGCSVRSLPLLLTHSQAIALSLTCCRAIAPPSHSYHAIAFSLNQTRASAKRFLAPIDDAYFSRDLENLSPNLSPALE